MPPQSRRKTAEIERKTSAAPARKPDERLKATLAVMAKLNRPTRGHDEFGPGTVVRADEIRPVSRATTGALAYDVAMTGGLPRNQWTEVVGLENSGKTTFILKSLAANQAADAGYICIWVASEAFDAGLATMCGVDNSRVFLIEENIMEYAFQHVLEFVHERACDMVVIDSYPAMTTKLEDEKSMDEVTMGGAKILNQFMRKCTKASKRSLTDPEDRPFTGVIVNQWREKIGVIKGDPRTTSGGKGKNYWMYARLDVKRDEWILNAAKEKVGQVIKIVCFKMKGARPQLVGQADYYFADVFDADTGEVTHAAGSYDDFKQIITLALYYDVIGRIGNGYAARDGSFIKSMVLLQAALDADAEWRAEIKREVLRIAATGKAPVEVEEEETVVEPTPIAPRQRRRSL